MLGNLASLLNELKNRQYADIRNPDRCAETVRYRTRDVLIEAAARDVADALDGHFLEKRHDRLHIDHRRRQQRVAKRCAAQCLHRLRHRFLRLVIDIKNLPHQGETIGMNARGRQRNDYIAGLHRVVVNDLIFVDDTDREAREVELILRIEARHLGSLAADEG